MIDRDTAIQWAKDAGFVGSIISLGYELATPEHIQALITRAQNEAFERAAQLAEDGDDLLLLMGEWHAKRLRALKTGGEK